MNAMSEEREIEILCQSKIEVPHSKFENTSPSVFHAAYIASSSLTIDVAACCHLLAVRTQFRTETVSSNPRVV